MKVIIAGGRDYEVTAVDRHLLDKLSEDWHITHVISGRARGADTGGERWAVMRGIPVIPYPADWDRYGRSAGPRRNEEMARVADGLIAFPGGVGTQDMIDRARRRGLRVYEVKR